MTRRSARTILPRLAGATMALAVSSAAGQTQPAVPGPASVTPEVLGNLLQMLMQGQSQPAAPVNTNQQSPANSAQLNQLGQPSPIQQVPNVPAAPGPSPVDAESLARIREAMDVDAFERINLHVVNEDLPTVLRLLSIETERNIVVSSSVNARITADFYRVSFYDALNAMLDVNDLSYEERGEFIYVRTNEEIQTAETDPDARIARVIELSYLNATDATALATPLLSEGGAITSPTPPADFAIPDEEPIGSDNYASGSVVVVHDFPARIERIEELLRRLDRAPQQVLVEATILQATVDETNAWGVDFSVLADIEFAELTNPLGAVTQLFDGSTAGEGTGVSSDVGNTSAGGGLKVGVLTDSVSVFVRALDEVTDVTTISRPKLLTLNRQPARVLVGTRVGFLNSTTANQNTTVQEVDFLNTGTQLRVRPFIMEDGQIRLELRPQVSSATLRTTAAPGGGSIVIPDEDTTELVTNIIVADGETIVLGGLFTEMTTSARRQVPGAGDIPIIGSAFRGRDDSVGRNEIIFLIRPTILDQPTASRQGIAGERSTEQARLGARRGLLPWSREQRVGQLLIDAENLRRDGKTKKALMNVERALGLAPASLEAARMRERLLGDELLWPEQSVLESILRGDRP
ncbi:MAG: hypothetical protein AAGI17_06175 [Planctomycetota bacterium]